MSTNILIAHASTHGSTAEVAEYMGNILGEYSASVTVADVNTVRNVDKYDTFVLGSAIQKGMWLPSFTNMTARFENTLANKPVYLFLMCIVALEQDGKHHAREDYVMPKVIHRLNIPPENIEAFAGKLNWNEINGDERWLLRTHYDGQHLPIDGSKSDFRDWDAIQQWTRAIAEDLDLSPRRRLFW